MSLAEHPEQRHEIIIVKRGGDGHDAHHGGVWKIAFADFMSVYLGLLLGLDPSPIVPIDQLKARIAT